MSLDSATSDAVRAGLAAAVVADNVGRVVSRAGAITDDDLSALAELLTSLSGAQRARLFAGELIKLLLGERDIRVGLAGECLYVVAIAETPTSSEWMMNSYARSLRNEVARTLQGMPDRRLWLQPLDRGSSGPPSGPASMPLIEIGVTFGVGKPGRGQT